MENEKIKLVNDDLGTKEFTLKHAEALLNYEQSRKLNLWRIKDADKYHFVNGKIKQRTSAKTTERADKPTGDKSGQKAAE